MTHTPLPRTYSLPQPNGADLLVADHVDAAQAPFCLWHLKGETLPYVLTPLAEELDDLVFEFGDCLAEEYGWRSDVARDTDGSLLPIASDDDIVRALRTSVPVCAVLEAVCRVLLGRDVTTLPPTLAAALESGERLPWLAEGRMAGETQPRHVPSGS